MRLGFQPILTLILFVIAFLPRADANQLDVDFSTGTVIWTNTTGSDINITGYSISSALGGIEFLNWKSITDNYDSNSGGSVDPTFTWFEFGANDKLLGEGTLGFATLAPGGRINLGVGLWDKVSFDLVFEYTNALNQAAFGVVNYDTIPLLDADFDNDGDVDGSDFLAWQVGFGKQGGASLSDGDADANGSVGASDLIVWKDQYGASSSMGNGSNASGGLSFGAAVPEPGTWVMGILAMATFGLFTLVGRLYSSRQYCFHRARRKNR